MEDLQSRIDAVTARYQPEIDGLEADGRALADGTDDPNAIGAVVDVDFDIDWRDREILIDLPSVTMRDRNLALDLPQVAMKQKRIVFHTPSVRMENRVVGKYPEVRGFTVRWRDMVTKVPVTFMERQEIVFDIPEVRMERRDVTLKIPEFSMNRQRWVIRLPEFTLKSVKAEARQLQERGEELQRRGEEIGRRMKEEIELLIASVYGPLTETGQQLRGDVSGSFGEAIRAVETAIGDLAARKIDPIRIPAEGGEINLRKELATLVGERERIEAELDEALAIEREPAAGDSPQPA